MAGFKSFEEIGAWQKARELTNEIYAATRVSSFARDYGLCSQIQRSSVSIMSNIAEGYERSGQKEFHHFLSIAKGSAGEVRCQLYIARDQGYLNAVESDKLMQMATEISRMIAGIMAHLRGTSGK